MNEKVGRVASLVTLVAVAAFALSMLLGSDAGSYAASLFISWGFVPMVCAFAASARAQARAAALAAVAFAAIYAVLIGAVYFTQLTTVRLSALTPQARGLLDYGQFGLFFNLDLLGYAFMAFSTFFAGLAIAPADRPDRWLRNLLMIHGAYAIALILPVLGVFRPGMAGGDLIGLLILEFWCAYFIPVCALAYRHFRGGARAE